MYFMEDRGGCSLFLWITIRFPEDRQTHPHTKSSKIESQMTKKIIDNKYVNNK